MSCYLDQLWSWLIFFFSVVFGVMVVNGSRKIWFARTCLHQILIFAIFNSFAGYPTNPQTVANLQLLELPYLQRGNQSFSVHVVANEPTPLPTCLPLQYSLVDMSFILLCTSMLLVLFFLSSFRVYLDWWSVE